MASKDSTCSLHSFGGGGGHGADPMETQHAFTGNLANGGPRLPEGPAGARAAAFSCSAAVVAQRALLASSRRRVGSRRVGGGETKSTVPSRLSKVSAAEDYAS